MFVLLATSCDPYFQTNDRAVGVTITDGGTIVGYVGGCGDDRLDSVRLLLWKGSKVGDADDIVLWEAVARQEPVLISDAWRFEVGVAPEGMRETQPLVEALGPRDRLGVAVEVHGLGVSATGFHLRDLQAGHVKVGLGTVSPAAFPSVGAGVCSSN
jgi:hypothetical protein